MSASIDQDVVGWDIGGAHLKAARARGGVIVEVVQVPCPLWKGMHELDAAFAAAEAVVGREGRHAVTMTGELVDYFDSRAAGVAGLAAAVAARHPDAEIYASGAGFVSAPAAAGLVDAVASVNWHATAAWAAQALGEGVLIDMGSTTTDIVPFKGGRVGARGQTDSERMAAGELVYTGATRTPLMALASRAPVRGAWAGVMAEWFANIGDVNRILGLIGPEDDQHPTADGKDKGGVNDVRRLLRMVGRDVGDLSQEEVRLLAGWFSEAQIRAASDGLGLVLSVAGLAADAPVVACGTGSAVVAEVARRAGRALTDWSALIPLSSSADEGLWRRASIAAPAVSVALLRQLGKNSQP
ncbi:hydantoinase/oxoprolinase family protein [Oryzibacter oryziterrae]|uniref:hydantoinase/oxoprolinase family protein n=1 Tax=Oryzibacter oryziterrae TaxID=2766474 RepID=UPI001F2F20B8|nr:hydantoinase/oxoprolinase family protein [Oryzibacter oryziterrae]